MATIYNELGGRRAVALLKKQSIGELNRIAGANPVFREVELLIEQTFDLRTPTYKRRPSNLVSVFLGSGRFNMVPPDLREQYEALMKSIAEFLFRLGYKENILTYQERRLAGGTGKDGFAGNPHVPLCMLEDGVSLRETVKARSLALISSAQRAYYGGQAGLSLAIALEDIDGDGRTVRDPRVIDFEKFEREYRRRHQSPDQLFSACSVERYPKPILYPHE